MPRRGLDQQRVVDAAADLADEVGFDQLGVTELARRLGVRTASLYSHIRGSEDLRTRVALSALTEMADLAATAMAGRSRAEALAALAGTYRDYARAHPGRYRASRLRLAPETTAASDGVRHAELARAVLRGYGVEGVDATHAVRLIGSTVHGFVDLEGAGGFAHSEPSSDESWLRVLDGLDQLLGTWGRQG